MLKFFKNPFAITGTRAAIPAADPGTGAVSYPTGFGPQYQLPKTDPLSRNIPRDQTNQLYFDLTNELKLIQEHGVPDFITAALNEGVAKEYSIGDRVRYDDGTATRVYESRTNANTALPTVPASWRLVQTGTPIATAGGTANALTAAFSPTLYSVQNGMLFTIEHAAANTGATTLAVDGGAALPVVKSSGAPLVAGDIPGANSWGLYTFDSSLASYVLLNPTALGPATTAEAQAQAVNTSAITPLRLAQALQGANQSLAGTGFQRFPGGLIVQWGTGNIPAGGGGGTLTLPLAFPNANLCVLATHVGANSAVNVVTTGSGLTVVGFVHNDAITAAVSYIAIGR